MRRCYLLSKPLSPSTHIRRIGPFDVHRGATKGIIEVFAGDPGHPVKKLNLLNKMYMTSLVHLCDMLSEELNSEARVAVFTSHKGCSFSAGIDLEELVSLPASSLPFNGGAPSQLARQDSTGAVDGSLTLPSPYPAMGAQRRHRTVREFQDSISALARCRIPIIAAIDQHCIGGATSIATACDVRYATVGTTFSVKEAAVGLAADIGVLQRLPSIVGEGRARELSLTARDFSGKEAKEIRFVEDIGDDYDAMLGLARQTADQMAACSPLAVQNTKLVMNWQREKDVQASLEYLAAINASSLACDDIAEAVAAMKKRRKPVFTNYMVNYGDSRYGK